MNYRVYDGDICIITVVRVWCKNLEICVNKQRIQEFFVVDFVLYGFWLRSDNAKSVLTKKHCFME